MPIKILMPALSPTMTEGNLAKWLKQEGDEITAGDVIAEIETDKATMEVEAVDEGRLGKILVPEGTQGVAVNQPIALLLEEGEDDSALDSAGGETASPAGNGAGGPDRPVDHAVEPKTAQRGDGAAASGPATSAADHGVRGGDSRVFASPLARRMAAQAGIDLAAVAGTGPNGRIVKADVEAAASGKGKSPERPAAAPTQPAPAPAAAAPAAAPKPAAGPNAKELADKLGLRYREIPNSGMRKVIARRLTEAKQTVPHFYLTIDCQIDELLKVRKELNGRSDAYKLSVNDFVIRAAALALRKVPAANASWTDEAILMYEHVDMSVAVATPSGLITPIIKNADQKGLAQISDEMKELAQRARDGKLKPEEFQGGTFSISNLGMYGIRDFGAIINPPQGCILAVGMGEQRPIVKDGALAVATIMSCTLSVDHRVVDGAVGAEYMAVFKTLIEDPLSMLL